MQIPTKIPTGATQIRVPRYNNIDKRFIEEYFKMMGGLRSMV